jgi:hypothetical protein
MKQLTLLTHLRFSQRFLSSDSSNDLPPPHPMTSLSPAWHTSKTTVHSFISSLFSGNFLLFQIWNHSYWFCLIFLMFPYHLILLFIHLSSNASLFKLHPILLFLILSLLVALPPLFCYFIRFSFACFASVRQRGPWNERSNSGVMRAPTSRHWMLNRLSQISLLPIILNLTFSKP